MNSAQYYEMIRELKEINRKLDLLIIRPNITYTYTPPPPYKTSGVGTGPIGVEQEFPFKETRSDEPQG